MDRTVDRRRRRAVEEAGLGPARPAGGVAGHLRGSAIAARVGVGDLRLGRPPELRELVGRGQRQERELDARASGGEHGLAGRHAFDPVEGDRA